jgi:hypothetical protein
MKHQDARWHPKEKERTYALVKDETNPIDGGSSRRRLTDFLFHIW